MDSMTFQSLTFGGHFNQRLDNMKVATGLLESLTFETFFKQRLSNMTFIFFIFGGSYISHPLGYILNNTLTYILISLPLFIQIPACQKGHFTAVGNLSGTFQKGLILNLASTAGSQRCWLNIHRYFHFSLSLSLYIYIYTYMVTTLRTEVNTIPQCPLTAPMSKSQGWTLDEHFSSNIYIYVQIIDLKIQKYNQTFGSNLKCEL